MRLTIDLIIQSPQGFSPSKEWTLTIRGSKIDTIENMGTTQDHFEGIDLSDNEIIRLENFPPLPHLNTLILCNNRIARIDRDIGKCLPNLKALILTNNKIERLMDLYPIFGFKNLERLSLLDNPVSALEHYRLFVIYHNPKIRFLDFERVRNFEREEANRIFGGDKGLQLLAEIAPIPQIDMDSKSKDSNEENNVLPPEKLEKIKAAIAKASSLEEVARLETALKMGTIPEDLDV